MSYDDRYRNKYRGTQPTDGDQYVRITRSTAAAVRYQDVDVCGDFDDSGPYNMEGTWQWQLPSNNNHLLKRESGSSSDAVRTGVVMNDPGDMIVASVLNEGAHAMTLYTNSRTPGRRRALST